MFVCFVVIQAFSQTLFTYGPHKVDKAEFLRAYNKNKTPVADKAQSLKEYLDLYTKFKLKVRAAQELQLDSLQQMKYDLQNFRSQVEESYLNDKKEMNALIEEAIQRSTKDIHVLHFYVNIDSANSPADTLKAYKSLSELVGELKKGNNSYGALAERYPEIKQNDLGYLTALTLPYEIENLVYNLKPGDVSGIYRTRSALHIFKNEEERKSAGKWKIAQILLSVPPEASVGEVKMIAAKADSLYTLIIKGADFAQLAKEYSEDRLTYLNGGELPEFGTGKFDLPFEKKVFELKKDGEISKPFLTRFGYHIIKRLEQRDLPTDRSDETFLFAIKQKISQDSRINAAKSDFLKSVKIKTGYKRNMAIKNGELFRYADSVTVSNQVGNYPIGNKTILSFTKLNVKGSDWLNFVKDYKLNADVYKGENNKDLLDKFIATISFDYYRKHLEEFNQDFKNQLQEFREGNMLFEIMERNVWSKAGADSLGLLQHYNTHKENYKWAASADILLFNCSDNTIAEQAAVALRNGKSWRELADESDGKLQSDSGRYELTQLQLPEGTVVLDGLISKPFINGGDNTASFIKVLRMFPENQPRTFEEAKGLVINDYQTFLEGRWIEELKKKYPIKINEPVFESLLK